MDADLDCESGGDGRPGSSCSEEGVSIIVDG
jgi:hypothetical protein